MPRFIPEIDPCLDINQGEFIMAGLMHRQLPERILVYHNLEWVMEGHDRDTLYNGETDFLLIDPPNGILILEVKTGNYTCDPETASWFRILNNGRREPMSQSPFDQALRSRNNLVNRLQKLPLFTRSIPFHYAHAVAFPVNDYEGELPMNTHRDLLWNSDDCHHHLAERVQRCFELSALPDPHPMTAEQVSAVQRVIHPQFRIFQTAHSRIQGEKEAFKRLTARQTEALSVFANHHRALIQGVAGSGKTLLAMHKARMLAQQGVRTLLLCYNEGLRDWIRTRLDDLPPDLLIVENYHGLALRFSDDPRVRSGGTGWMVDDVVAELVEAALQSLPDGQRFQALVVDEGQDFPDLWWITLEEAFRTDSRGGAGTYYVFYDLDQNIRGVPPDLPDLGPPFQLQQNCRNTLRIIELCRTVSPSLITPMDATPTGEDPTQVHVPNPRSAMAEISRTLSRWLDPAQGNLQHSQIAILTRRSLVEELLDLHSRRSTIFALTGSLADWRAGSAILLTTPNSFKGLEADAVITVDPLPPNDMPTVHHYVCRSRARHLLHMIRIIG